jgi:hypothetical protein
MSGQKTEWNVSSVAYRSIDTPCGRWRLLAHEANTLIPHQRDIGPSAAVNRAASKL